MNIIFRILCFLGFHIYREEPKKYYYERLCLGCLKYQFTMFDDPILECEWKNIKEIDYYES